MKRVFAAAILMGGFVTMLSGCPLYPVPPYNTSGDFTGTWSALIPALGEDPVTCNITLNLQQETLLNVYPLNHSITGEITFDFSCGVVQILVLLLGLPETVSYDIVIGTMAADGTINLVGADNETDFTSGLVIEATPTDSDGDKNIDALEGAWYFTVSSDSVPVLVQGDFSATKLAE